MNSRDQRQHTRTPLKCRLWIAYPDGEIVGETRDLSDGGVYVVHPELTRLPQGTRVVGQVLDLPIEAPKVIMEVMRTDGDGAGLRFLRDQD